MNQKKQSGEYKTREYLKTRKKKTIIEFMKWVNKNSGTNICTADMQTMFGKYLCHIDIVDWFALVIC